MPTSDNWENEFRTSKKRKLGNLLVFRCADASLWEGLSVRSSVRLSVRPSQKVSTFLLLPCWHLSLIKMNADYHFAFAPSSCMRIWAVRFRIGIGNEAEQFPRLRSKSLMKGLKSTHNSTLLQTKDEFHATSLDCHDNAYCLEMLKSDHDMSYWIKLTSWNAILLKKLWSLYLLITFIIQNCYLWTF